MKIITLIPSRLGSTRLPNKPLANIAGKAMILHVVDRVWEAGIKDVYVAAAEKEIADVVEKAGAKAVLTDADLPSGTDRIYQALQKIPNNQDVEYIINVQGDLPTIEPDVIKQTLELIKKGNYDIATAVAKITNNNEKTNHNVVKAIVSWKSEKEGQALYFTRATAPHGEGDLFHHIGLYIYKRSALEKFVKLESSPLEKREKLEQLRALENNMTIGVVKVETVPLGVDTIEDLETAREMLK
jgi:3-deoxy-manno-octulosonate cytidylyltransferase (CMP-KDO synthetase)